MKKSVVSNELDKNVPGESRNSFFCYRKAKGEAFAQIDTICIFCYD